MLQMPRKAESFSSLSRIFRNDVHLEKNEQNDTSLMLQYFSNKFIYIYRGPAEC